MYDLSRRLIIQTQQTCRATAERVENGTGHHELNDFD
jgi:hypothetical protein